MQNGKNLTINVKLYLLELLILHYRNSLIFIILKKYDSYILPYLYIIINKLLYFFTEFSNILRFLKRNIPQKLLITRNLVK